MKEQNYKKQGKSFLIFGVGLLIVFVVFTILIQAVDVKPIGVNGTNIGFSTLNTWFHSLTGVNWSLYNITDWLGLVPVFICMAFAGTQTPLVGPL